MILHLWFTSIACSNPTVTSTAQEGDYLDNPHYPPHVSENSKPLNGSISSGAAPKYDQSKQTIMVPQGGPQYPFVHAAPNYGFPFIQPTLGSQMVPCEGPDPQAWILFFPIDFLTTIIFQSFVYHALKIAPNVQGFWLWLNPAIKLLFFFLFQFST